jgi:hypothetical protein
MVDRSAGKSAIVTKNGCAAPLDGPQVFLNRLKMNR